MSDDRSPLRLVLVVDPINADWMQTYNAQGNMLAVQDLPRPLQFRVRPIALALMELKVHRCVVEEYGSFFFVADQEPLNPDVLEIRELEHKLRLIQWWIDYFHRRQLSQPDFIGRQPHKTWRCECGEDVRASKELCENRTCPSWNFWMQCTGQKIRVVTKRSEEKTG